MSSAGHLFVISVSKKRPKKDTGKVSHFQKTRRTKPTQINAMTSRKSTRCQISVAPCSALLLHSGVVVIYTNQGPSHPPKRGRSSDQRRFASSSALSVVPGRSLGDIVRGGEHPAILGLNPNRRFLLLEDHVFTSEDNSLLFPALEAFVGGIAPTRVLDEILVPAPDTFKDLNTEQQRVAHPLSLTCAMEVAGPPGTGKTKTITELVRSLLECTDLNMIVLSERNGAIDAIASKMAGDCLLFEVQGKKLVPKVINVELWLRIIAFGSSGAIGNSTRLFTPNAKMR